MNDTVVNVGCAIIIGLIYRHLYAVVAAILYSLKGHL